MKKLLLLLFVLMNTVAYSKENGAFIGFKLSNGKSTIKHEVSLFNTNDSYKDKQYNIGGYFNYGGTIKNISIYSGIGYNLYQYKYTMLGFTSPFGSLGIIGVDQKLHVINIPVNVDYNLNVYKQKLFVIVGLGGELLCITNKKSLSVREITADQDLKNRKTVSFAITARTGLLYNINKRLDCYAFFDFNHHVTPFFNQKEDIAIIEAKTYPYVLAGSIGMNVKFYKKTKNEIVK